MALFQYFQRSSTPLPDVYAPLSKVVPSQAIAAANEEVKAAVDAEPGQKQTRGPYSVFSPEEKAKIGRRASQHGIAATIRHFAKKGPRFSDLKESSVRTWKKKYLSTVKAEKDGSIITKLPSARRGRPLLLGRSLDAQVQMYLQQLRENGAVVNSAIVFACAKSVVKNYDRNFFLDNGGHLALTRDWAKGLLRRMGFVKRRATTKSKVSVADFQIRKDQFFFDVRSIMEMGSIPENLVINWDQTAIHYVPVSNWTCAVYGSKRVEIAGVDDKRQFTALFAASMNGDFLPQQLIYQGKTSKCLLAAAFPSDWHITYTENHWSNEKIMAAYLDCLLLPYIDKQRRVLGLSPEFPALVIFDCFKAQCTEKSLSTLDAHNVLIAVVPPNCTDRLQPLDISVNKSVKEHLRDQFQEWYSQQFLRQLQKGSGETITPVNLALSVVKPLGARWMINTYNYLQTNPSIIRNGFRKAGLMWD